MGGLIIRMGELDQLALRALLNRRTPWIDPVMRTLTHIGNAPTMIGTALVVAFLAGPALADAGAVSALALVISHAAVQLLKRSVARPRPRLPTGIGSLVAAPDRFSFPSGHAAAALSVALPIAMAVGPLVGITLLVLAILVGISRCYLGVHYPGDVVVGWALAIAGVLVSPIVLTAPSLA